MAFSATFRPDAAALEAADLVVLTAFFDLLAAFLTAAFALVAALDATFLAAVFLGDAFLGAAFFDDDFLVTAPKSFFEITALSPALSNPF